MKCCCPTCKCKMIYNTKNVHRPFCSERCRLVDLGQWLEEDYRVPVVGQMTPGSYESEGQ